MNLQPLPGCTAEEYLRALREIEKKTQEMFPLDLFIALAEEIRIQSIKRHPFFRFLLFVKSVVTALQFGHNKKGNV